MKTIAVGLDWASDSKNRAVVQLRAERGAIHVEDIVSPAEDSWTTQLFNDQRVDVFGVDTPFGWPRSFITFVKSWTAAGGGGVVPSRDQFRFRATDRYVWEHFKAPLSVSSDRIALATRTWIEFAQANALVKRFAVETGAISRGAIIEVYPAATLLAVREEAGISALAAKKFKGESASRRVALGKLFALFKVKGDVRNVSRSDHVADAFLAALSALIAAGAVSGWATAPQPATERHLHIIEGWMFVPQPGRAS